MSRLLGDGKQLFQYATALGVGSSFLLEFLHCMPQRLRARSNSNPIAPVKTPRNVKNHPLPITSIRGCMIATATAEITHRHILLAVDAVPGVSGKTDRKS